MAIHGHGLCFSVCLLVPAMAFLNEWIITSKMGQCFIIAIENEVGQTSKSKLMNYVRKKKLKLGMVMCNYLSTTI